MRLRAIIIVVVLVVLAGIAGYRAEIAFPASPALNKTLTPSTQSAPKNIGYYDILGRTVDREEAARLMQDEAGQKLLSPDSGAIEITEDLISLGRDAFYTETFGNEYFFTDVAGILSGPLNIGSLTKAIAALKGKPTANLQVSLDRDMTVGDRAFKKETVLNTGLDVPAGSLVPLGMRVVVNQGKVRVGVTCAACHATVDVKTGSILEGAPNPDLDTGLLLALATNSTAMFRQTGTNPTQLSPGQHTYLKANNEEAYLPDAKQVEDAVDADLLSWMPGNFDSSGDMGNNPSQNPSSYTHEAYPYGWSGFSALGWFHGLTTLNNNVHATNSDPTTGADSSEQLLGIDKETYLGVILQNSANPDFRLPERVRPSAFFEQIDPTPGEPGMNQVIRMPGYPLGSRFALDGLMANKPGLPVGSQLNGMSAWQNTLAPPPYQSASGEAVKHGAAVFTKAGCAACHSGRYFTNHAIVSEGEIKSQPSRAKALAAFPRVFHLPETYPPNVSVPLPPNPPVLTVPTEITPKRDQELAYAANNPAGGYKVPSLIGLAVTAPYLHDGGVAASAQALQQDAASGTITVKNSDQLGALGILQHIPPDPEASLRLLVDRKLRQPMIAANRANADLQRSNIDGSGHLYWVDEKAGFTTQEQSDLIQFLLSLDDDPEVLPDSD